MAVANISNKILICCDKAIAAAICACKLLFAAATVVVLLVTYVSCTDPDVQEQTTKLFWIAASLSCLGVISSWKVRRRNENIYSDPAIDHSDLRQ